MGHTQRTRRFSRRNWIILAVFGLLIVATLAFGPAARESASTIQCDGSVPRWMLPDDDRELGGCVPLRPAWEGWLPWNWGRQDLVCLGLCTDHPLQGP